MIIYEVYDNGLDDSGASYFPSKAKAMAFARQEARGGSYTTVTRVTVGPLTKALFIAALHHEGWASGAEELAHFEPPP